MGGGEREELEREFEPFVVDRIEEVEERGGGEEVVVEVVVAVGWTEGEEREGRSGGEVTCEGW